MNRHSRTRFVQIFALALLTSQLVSCIVVPLPAKETTTGHPFTIEDVESQIAGAESPLDVKAMLGEPVLNFGLDQVLVYLWTVNKGKFLVLFLPPGGGDVTAWTDSSALFVAFDTNGHVLRVGTEKYSAGRSVSYQLRDWLSADSLTAGMVGTPIDQPTVNQQTLIVYHERPTSGCIGNKLNYWTRNFIPSIALDGQVIGDVAKGEYLVSKIDPGPHQITFNFKPDYRYATFIESDNGIALKKTVDITVELHHSTYMETGVCFKKEKGSWWKSGKVTEEVVAEPVDPATAMEAISKLKAAW